MCWKVYQNTHSCIRNQHTLATAQTTLNSQQAPAFASRHTSNRTPASSLPPGPKHKGRSRLTWIMHACRWIAHNHESCNAHDQCQWWQFTLIVFSRVQVFHWWVTLACRSAYTTRGLPQNRLYGLDQLLTDHSQSMDYFWLPDYVPLPPPPTHNNTV